MSDQDKAYTLRDLHVRLIDILEKENDDLANHRTMSIQQHLQEKTNLCQLYDRQMRIIKARPAILDSLETDEKDELKDLATKLNELMSHNEKALRIAINSTRRVFEHVSEASRSLTQKQGIYSGSGTMGTGKNDPVSPIAMQDLI